MKQMTVKHKRRRLSIFICTILSFLFLAPAGMVCADMTVPVTPKNLPKTDATFILTYDGPVTGLTLVTPDGRTQSESGNGSVIS